MLAETIYSRIPVPGFYANASKKGAVRGRDVAKNKKT